MGEEVAQEGMTAVVTALKTGITAESMFGVIAELVPLILAIIPVSLGLYFLRKLVKGAGQAKLRF